MKKSLYDIEAVESFLTAAGLGHKELRRSRRLLYREFVPPEDMPWEDDLKASFLENFETNWLKLVAKADSEIDGATKLLFQTADGKNIETVILRIETGRTSICVSSQVGCTEQCRFCATGEITTDGDVDIATNGEVNNITVGNHHLEALAWYIGNGIDSIPHLNAEFMQTVVEALQIIETHTHPSVSTPNEENLIKAKRQAAAAQKIRMDNISE